MDDFVISVYVANVKAVWNGETTSEESILRILYNAIVIPMNLKAQGKTKNETSKDALDVDKTRTSLVMNRKSNVHRKLVKAASDPKVTNSIEAYFDEEIVSNILPGQENNLEYRLNEITQHCRLLSDEDKRILQDDYENGSLAKFLSDCYLMVLPMDNVLPQHHRKNRQGNSAELRNTDKHHPLKIDPVPPRATRDEKVYTGAILDCYGEEEDDDHFTEEKLDAYPEYRDEYDDQRQFYFAAIAVERGTRDFYGEDADSQFNDLLDDTYNGVIQTWRDTGKDGGLHRMRSVLSQAAKLPLDGTWLSKDTSWLGSAQKQGICHILVNQNRLKGWVRKNAG